MILQKNINSKENLEEKTMRTNVTGISKYYLEEVLAKGKNFPSGTWSGDKK